MQYRYLGVKPFTTEERNLFFGRDEDIEKLFKVIELEKLVVLYGKSGYGKSSLINAGLKPVLSENNYHLIYVRFGSYSDEQNQTLNDKLVSKLPVNQLNAAIPQQNSQATNNR